jgi:hypothetical protein
MKRLPILSAKQDPTNSILSTGFISIADFPISTFVCSFIMCKVLCKVTKTRAKHKRNLFIFVLPGADNLFKVTKTRAKHKRNLLIFIKKPHKNRIKAQQRFVCTHTICNFATGSNLNRIENKEKHRKGKG